MKLDDKTNRILKDFPKRLERNELLKLLVENTSISEAKSQPTAKRKNVLQTFLRNWFYLNSYLHPLYDLFYDTFYQRFQNLHQDNFIPILNATIDWYKNAKVNGYQPPILNDNQVDGFSIVGVSGVGKTHCTKHILRKCFDQLIKRENIQITYVITNCSETSSTKQLVINFLAAVDHLLGKVEDGYVKEYGGLSAPFIEAAAANVAHRHAIGAWVIDEVHHLKDIPFKSAAQIINFLKNISAVIGMPIIYIGTPEVYKVLGGNFQIGRRAEGDGSIFWGRYAWNLSPEQINNDIYCKDDWKDLIESLWKRTVLRKNGKLTEAIIDAYYKASKGILKRVLSIHKRAQVIAMDEGLERITPEVIDEARKYFQLTENMVSALDSIQHDLVADYPDLSMRAINVVDNILKTNLSPREVVDVVLENGFSKEEVVMIIKALMEREKIDLPTGKNRKKATNGSKRPGKKAKSKNAKGAQGELVSKVKRSSTREEVYEVMKNAGLTDLSSIQKERGE